MKIFHPTSMLCGLSFTSLQSIWDLSSISLHLRELMLNQYISLKCIPLFLSMALWPRLTNMLPYQQSACFLSPEPDLRHTGRATKVFSSTLTWYTSNRSWVARWCSIMLLSGSSYQMHTLVIDRQRARFNPQHSAHSEESEKRGYGASGNTNLALAVFSCLWESLIVFAKDWLHVWA